MWKLPITSTGLVILGLALMITAFSIRSLERSDSPYTKALSIAVLGLVMLVAGLILAAYCCVVANRDEAASKPTANEIRGDENLQPLLDLSIPPLTELPVCPKWEPNAEAFFTLEELCEKLSIKGIVDFKTVDKNPKEICVTVSDRARNIVHSVILRINKLGIEKLEPPVNGKNYFIANDTWSKVFLDFEHEGKSFAHTLFLDRGKHLGCIFQDAPSNRGKRENYEILACSDLKNIPLRSIQNYKLHTYALENNQVITKIEERTVVPEAKVPALSFVKEPVEGIAPGSPALGANE